MKRTLRGGWRPVAVVVLLGVAIAASTGAVGALRVGHEAAAVAQTLWALLAFVVAWLLVLPAALR